MNEQLPSVEQAFDPEARQSQANWEAYLESRPFEGRQGEILHPETGKIINPDQYFDEQSKAADEKHSDQTAYEDMSVPQLARKLGQSEFYDDETSRKGINDVLQGKLDVLDEKYFSERDDSSTHSTHNNPDKDKNHNDLRSDKLWDRVKTIRDREIERLGDAAQAEAVESKNESQPSKDVDTGESKTVYEPDWVIADPDEAPTEEMPANSEIDKEETRFTRFKRGVRKHLRENPIKEAPTLPVGYEHPIDRFDRLYTFPAKERVNQEMVAVVRELGNLAIDAVIVAQDTGIKLNEKAKDATARTAEHVGRVTRRTDYLGRIALDRIAIYAGNATARIRERLAQEKEELEDEK